LVDQADPPEVTSNEDDISDTAFANIAHVLAASTSTLRTLQDPRNHQEAQAHPDAHLWDLATQSEIQSLERMKTFVEVDELPPGRKAILYVIGILTGLRFSSNIFRLGIMTIK